MVILHFEKKKQLGNNLQDFIITSVDVKEDWKNKILISFCIIQMHYDGEKKYEILKYDSSHGFCHVHRYYRSLKPEREILAGKELCSKTFEELKKDIICNWMKYKRFYFEKYYNEKII